MSGRRVRLDTEMVRRKLASSRTAAQALITRGDVSVEGVAVAKPASLITAQQAIDVAVESPRFASRGGLKLDAALDDLGIDPTGRVALDAGAAHGGFSDVLLRRGVAHVVAVDVAYGQFAWRLRTDPRVTVLERFNVRRLTAADLGDHVPDLVVADLSFISLTTVLPALARSVSPTATLLPMVKPQFEAGPRNVGKGGVVRDPDIWHQTITKVIQIAADLGFVLRGVVPSQVPGPAGNIEFFLHLGGGAGPQPLAGDAERMIAEAVGEGKLLRAGGH